MCHYGSAFGWRPRGTGIILAILSLTALVTSFSESMLVPALPRPYKRHSTTTEAVIAWVPGIDSTVRSLRRPRSANSVIPMERNRGFLPYIAIVLYTIAVIGNGFAWSVESLLAFRAIQGIGLAMFPFSAFAIIRDRFQHEKVATATGFVKRERSPWGRLSGLSAEDGSRRRLAGRRTIPFSAPVAAIVTALIAWGVPEPPFHAFPIRLLGHHLTRARDSRFSGTAHTERVWGWSSPYTLALLTLGVAATIASVSCGASRP